MYTYTPTSRKYPWFVKGDLDGFFGLAVDNLVQVLVIVALCQQICHFSDALIYTRVLPAIAVSLFIGNIYYALHARRVAKRDKDLTTTALPYGINTPSVFAYILFILGPVYARNVGVMGEEAASHLAWQVGIVACIGSGIIEFLGAFIGSWIRRVTPRAALLSALAAIGVIFIASPFAFQIFERPLIAMVPMFIVLIGYFARVRLPLGLPSGFVAVIVGTILAWTIPLAIGPQVMSTEAVQAATQWVARDVESLKIPQWCGGEVLALFENHTDMLWAFLGVIVPMGLINAIGSLQNIESAEAAGDKFSTGPCMAVNGIGSIAAGLFGSCFPTTIYIGHPGWKALGARCGYSIINGFFFSIVFVLGLGSLAVSIIPIEAGMAIVMWIGVIITAQSYEAVPKKHYPAVAIAFFPAVAAIAVLLIPDILNGIGAETGILPMINEHGEMLTNPAIRTDNWWPVGVYALAGANSGFIITCIIISAASAFLIDRKFKAAAIWCVVGAIMTLAGFQHAYRIEPGKYAVSPQELLAWQRSEDTFKDTSLYLAKTEGAFWHRGYRIAAGYGAAALMLFGVYAMRRRGKGFEDIAPEGIDHEDFDAPTPETARSFSSRDPVQTPVRTPPPNHKEMLPLSEEPSSVMEDDAPKPDAEVDDDPDVEPGPGDKWNP